MWLLLMLAIGWVGLPVAQAATFNVREFGALGDGKSLDTAAINRAIEACAKDGGGTVLFPPGHYISGSIHLTSHLTINLEQGALLEGAPDSAKAYDAPEPFVGKKYQDFGHSHFRNSLMWGEGLSDVTLCGEGRIDGGGLKHGRSGDPVAGEGNKMIALKLSRKITIKDLTLTKAGHFALLLTGCEQVNLLNLTIDTDRDAIDVDCCRNVLIDGCRVNTEFDDGIVFKTSWALGERRACENITVANCVVSGYAVGTMLDGRRLTTTPGIGGIKFGTESKGDFRNVLINNCVFDHGKGFALNSVDGATVENVIATNLVMKDISMEPIFLRLGRRMMAPDGTPIGKMRRIRISNVVIEGGDPLWGNAIMGIKGHPIEDVEIRNVTYLSKGGGTLAQAALQVPAAETEHPWIPYFKTDFPDYGFFCREVKGLVFENVHLGFDQPDLRPALVCENVEGLLLDRFSCQRATGGLAPLVMRDVKDVTIERAPDLGLVEAPRVEALRVSLDPSMPVHEVRAGKGLALFNRSVPVELGQSLAVSATLRAETAGLAAVRLLADERVLGEQYIWFERGEAREVTFADVTMKKAGNPLLTINATGPGVRLRVRRPAR